MFTGSAVTQKFVFLCNFCSCIYSSSPEGMQEYCLESAADKLTLSELVKKFPAFY
jgi:hypothetical protein